MASATVASFISVGYIYTPQRWLDRPFSIAIVLLFPSRSPEVARARSAITGAVTDVRGVNRVAVTDRKITVSALALQRLYTISARRRRRKLSVSSGTLAESPKH